MANLLTIYSLKPGSVALSRGLVVTNAKPITVQQQELEDFPDLANNLAGAVANRIIQIISFDGSVLSAADLVNMGNGIHGHSHEGSGYDPLANSGVTPSTYTNATVTVNAEGIITAAASGATPVSSITPGTNITVTGSAATPTVSLANPLTGAITFSSSGSVALLGTNTGTFSEQVTFLNITTDGTTTISHTAPIPSEIYVSNWAASNRTIILPDPTTLSLPSGAIQRFRIRVSGSIGTNQLIVQVAGVPGNIDGVTVGSTYTLQDPQADVVLWTDGTSTGYHSDDAHQITRYAAGTTQAVGVRVRTATAAALGAQQYSPVLLLEGQGWATGTSNSQPVVFGWQTQPVQGNTAGGMLAVVSQIGGGSYSTVSTIDQSGNFAIGGQINFASAAGVTATAVGVGNLSGSLVLNALSGQGINLQIGGVNELTILPALTTFSSTAVSISGTMNSYTMTAANAISWATGTAVSDSAGTLVLNGHSAVDLQIAGVNKLVVTSALTTISSTTTTISGTLNSVTMTSANTISFASGSSLSDSAGSILLNGNSAVDLQISGANKLTVTAALTNISTTAVTIGGTMNSYTMTAGNTISWASGSSLNDTSGSLLLNGNAAVDLQVAGANKLTVTAASTNLSSTTITISGTLNNYTMTAGNKMAWASGSNIIDSGGTLEVIGNGAVQLQVGATVIFTAIGTTAQLQGTLQNKVSANEVTTATAGGIASPGNYTGFLSIKNNAGTTIKIPYFSA